MLIESVTTYNIRSGDVSVKASASTVVNENGTLRASARLLILGNALPSEHHGLCLPDVTEAWPSWNFT